MVDPFADLLSHVVKGLSRNKKRPLCYCPVVRPSGTFSNQCIESSRRPIIAVLMYLPMVSKDCAKGHALRTDRTGGKSRLGGGTKKWENGSKSKISCASYPKVRERERAAVVIGSLSACGPAVCALNPLFSRLFGH